MTTQYPSIDALKAQAKRLREAMTDHGETLSHSGALELVARQHGLRDWNTLAALSARPNEHPVQRLGVGDRVEGRYLNQRFAGTILALQPFGADLRKVTIHFDEPVDVVTFESFSAFRQRINAQIDEHGISPRKTSNGLPHLVLDL